MVNFSEARAVIAREENVQVFLVRVNNGNSRSARIIPESMSADEARSTARTLCMAGERASVHRVEMDAGALERLFGKKAGKLSVRAYIE